MVAVQNNCSTLYGTIGSYELIAPCFFVFIKTLFLTALDDAHYFFGIIAQLMPRKFLLACSNTSDVTLKPGIISYKKFPVASLNF